MFNEIANSEFVNVITSRNKCSSSTKGPNEFAQPATMSSSVYSNEDDIDNPAPTVIKRAKSHNELKADDEERLIVCIQGMSQKI